MSSLSAETRLSQVLDGVPGALDYVVSLNPHDFERLRHPMLRTYMAPRKLDHLQRGEPVDDAQDATLRADAHAASDQWRSPRPIG